MVISSQFRTSQTEPSEGLSVSHDQSLSVVSVGKGCFHNLPLMIKGECILRDVATAASVAIMKVHVSIIKFIYVLYTIHGLAESASPPTSAFPLSPSFSPPLPSLFFLAKI